MNSRRTVAHRQVRVNCELRANIVVVVVVHYTKTEFSFLFCITKWSRREEEGKEGKTTRESGRDDKLMSSSSSR